jgi:hypothetical protein
VLDREQEIITSYLQLDSLPRINGEAKGARLNKFLSGLTDAESLFFNHWFVNHSLIQIVTSCETPVKDRVSALKFYAELHNLFPEHSVVKNNG